MWYCIFNDVCVECYCTLFVFVPSFRYHSHTPGRNVLIQNLMSQMYSC
jgi:hypothetical protein